MNEARGRFITLEGVEGAGKTSALEAIGERLETRDIPVVFTREPGGTPLGESIRGILLGGDRETSISAESELLLMFAARAQHIADVIEPALARGDWVVCDRFGDASHAYQGFGRGVDRDWIGTLERRVQGDLEPDLTLLLDVGVASGRARAQQSGPADRFEREADAFFERVRAGYAKRCAEASQRFRCIDAERSAEAVRAEIMDCVDELIARG